MGSMGFGEILLIFLIFLLLFGAGRLPAVANGLGVPVKRFRSELKVAKDPDRSGGGDS